jgi:hypothetical protein
MITNYQPGSIKTMDNQIKRIFKISGKNTFSSNVLTDHHNIINIISNIDTSETVKRAITNSVIKILQFSNIDVPKQYKDYFKHICNKERIASLYAKKTETEKKSMVPFSHLIKTRELWKTKAMSTRKRADYLKYLVLSLYTMIPPLRGEEFYNTTVIDSQGNNLEKLSETLGYNFYDTHSNTLVISKYKTVRTYGLRLIKFTDELDNIVNTWMTTFNNTQLLIPDQNDNMMKQQSFTDMLFRIFRPLKISTSMIRKIYISEIAVHLSPDERKKISHIMAHSLIMQEFIYNKKF